MKLSEVGMIGLFSSFFWTLIKYSTYNGSLAVKKKNTLKTVRTVEVARGSDPLLSALGQIPLFSPGLLD